MRFIQINSYFLIFGYLLNDNNLGKGYKGRKFMGSYHEFNGINKDVDYQDLIKFNRFSFFL